LASCRLTGKETGLGRDLMVDGTRLELVTSALRTLRSPN
jgi:hypothetical protein